MSRISTPILAALVFTASSMASAQPVENPVAELQANTLICHNKASGALCQLWLNADGSYYLVYDRGRTHDVPMVGGVFRLEGREGRYVLRETKAGPALCLKPVRVAGKTYQIERSDEIFGGAGCYPFSPQGVGTNWTGKDRKGRDVQFWLVKGRG